MHAAKVLREQVLPVEIVVSEFLSVLIIIDQ